jgi:molybdopterin-guanine dinucleotide biosynthesis protein A
MYSAAILAGGRARRFGGLDKGTLPVDGRPIVDAQVAVLREITSDILMVGSDTAGHGPAGVRLVADIVPDLGPLGGLQAALTHASGEATAIVACDMPYLSAALLRHLLSLTSDADAVVPRTEGGYHPLCAAYTRACLAPIARRLDERRLKMTDLFADVRVRIVLAEEIDEFGDPDRLFANVNTPAEYQNLILSRA